MLAFTLPQLRESVLNALVLGLSRVTCLVAIDSEIFVVRRSEPCVGKKLISGMALQILRDDAIEAGYLDANNIVSFIVDNWVKNQYNDSIETQVTVPRFYDSISDLCDDYLPEELNLVKIVLHEVIE